MKVNNVYTINDMKEFLKLQNIYWDGKNFDSAYEDENYNDSYSYDYILHDVTVSNQQLMNGETFYDDTQIVGNESHSSKTKNVEYEDSNGDTAIIPAGFKVGTSSIVKTIANGLVIEDTDENQFVWVPVKDAIYDSKLGNDLNIESYYRTIATCDPDDTWDEKTGIKIALNKMKSKLDLAIDKRLSLFLNKLDKGVESFADKFFLNE